MGWREKRAGDRPIFSGIGVSDFLLATLLSLGKTLILTNSLCIG
jgi:hypothetical protein